MPFEKMKDWIAKEKDLGSPNPANIVLATTTAEKTPHSRIVAIKEILEDGILFFTQKGKRKAQELMHNPKASLTLWLPLQQRQIILDGYVILLTEVENDSYWEYLPRERQLLFSTYSPISDETISSRNDLALKQHALIEKYQNLPIPRNDCYMGFKFFPTTFYFYTLGIHDFSDLITYIFENHHWISKQLSP